MPPISGVSILITLLVISLHLRILTVSECCPPRLSSDENANVPQLPSVLLKRKLPWLRNITPYCFDCLVRVLAEPHIGKLGYPLVNTAHLAVAVIERNARRAGDRREHHAVPGGR